MSTFKLDRTAFKPQKKSQAANHSAFYKKITWQERLSVTFFLNSVAFQYYTNHPPRICRNQFSVKSFRNNG